MCFYTIEDEMRETMQNFEAQTVPGFPRTTGVIDGTHIRIKAPLKQPNAYFNREREPLGYHEVVFAKTCRTQNQE